MLTMPKAKPVSHFSLMRYTPERLADYARRASMQGNKERAFELACASIRARAYWYLLNGKWKQRNLRGISA